MRDKDWLYHLTNKSIARKIQTGGMTTTLSRIGMPVAAPSGAFSQNRKQKEADKQQDTLVKYLADLLSRGATLSTIQGTKGSYVPFSFAPSGSNSVDTPKLVATEKQLFERYCKLFRGLTKADWRKARTERSRREVGEAASSLLRNNKSHYLSRLAVQVVAATYAIEETLTSSHIYFFLPQYARVCYTDYMKHLNSNDVVMLRVHQEHIADLVQDDSEFRAKMTSSPVRPEVIELMEDHSRFVEEDYRCTSDNWKKIKEWGVRKSRPARSRNDYTG